jgi:hypothetical protein
MVSLFGRLPGRIATVGAPGVSPCRRNASIRTPRQIDQRMADEPDRHARPR